MEVLKMNVNQDFLDTWVRISPIHLDDEEIYPTRRASIGQIINLFNAGFTTFVRTNNIMGYLTSRGDGVIMEVHLGDVELADAFVNIISEEYEVIDNREVEE